MAMRRPISAQSRDAWGSMDQGCSNPGLDDDDLMPSAMEHEIQPKRREEQLKVQPQQNTGFLNIIQCGIRAIWATKQTEDTEGDQEKIIKTTLRELVIYCGFLLILCIMTFGMTSATMFYYTSVMTNLFTNGQWDNSNPNANFNGIGQPIDWFTFTLGPIIGQNGLPTPSPNGPPLLGGLYWESWYNGLNMTEENFGYIFYENKLQGLPRIRQVRVRNDSCEIHPDFKDTIVGCYASYSSVAESKDPFGLMNGTAWTYQSEKELDGSSYWGQVSTYGGGGFVQDLSITNAESTALLQPLFDNLWIDRATRAIFIDFTIYNANINLFCVIKYRISDLLTCLRTK
jgi:polycystin 2